MIDVHYVPERNKIKCMVEFHCNEQMDAEFSALMQGVITTEDIEMTYMFIDCLNDRLKKFQEELLHDKNNTGNKSKEQDN